MTRYKITKGPGTLFPEETFYRVYEKYAAEDKWFFIQAFHTEERARRFMETLRGMRQEGTREQLVAEFEF